MYLCSTKKLSSIFLQIRQLENEISVTKHHHRNEANEQSEAQPLLQPFPDLPAERTALREPDHTSFTDQQSPGQEQSMSGVLRQSKTTYVITTPSVWQPQADVMRSAGPFTSTPTKHSSPSSCAHQDTN